MVGWAVRQTVRSAGDLYTVATKALPLLLIVMIVLFINTEMWQVAGSLAGPVLWGSSGMLLIFGGLVTLDRTREQIATPGWTPRSRTSGPHVRARPGGSRRRTAAGGECGPAPAAAASDGHRRALDTGDPGRADWASGVGVLHRVRRRRHHRAGPAGLAGRPGFRRCLLDDRPGPRVVPRTDPAWPLSWERSPRSTRRFMPPAIRCTGPSFSDDVGASLQQAVDVRRAYLSVKGRQDA